MEINDTKLDQYYASAINTLHDITKQIDKRIQKIEAKTSNPSKLLKSPIQFENLQSEAQIIAPEPDVIYADTVHVSKHMKVDFINDHPISDFIKSTKELNIRHIKADSVQLNAPKNYKKLLSQSRNDHKLRSTDNYRATVRQVNTFSEHLQELNVDELKIDGMINDIDLLTLEQFALKTFANEQTIDANFHIDHANAVDVHNVNNLHVENIVRTTKGQHYDINQDIQFSQPLYVNRLYVNDRMNNLKIINGKFDALLKESNETQIISASKEFENVKLLEPIVLRGKIKSKSLEQINPIVSMSEPIILEGNFLCYCVLFIGVVRFVFLTKFFR